MTVKLLQLIVPDRIYTGLQAQDREDALRQVAEHIAPAAESSPEVILESLLERERLGSTSVGDGFAIPHCKCPGLREIVVAVARFQDGVDFGGSDGAPVRFLFVVLSPPDQPAVHLQVLSQIARVLKRKDVRKKLMQANDPHQVIEIIRSAAEAEGM